MPHDSPHCGISAQFMGQAWNCLNLKKSLKPSSSAFFRTIQLVHPFTNSTKVVSFGPAWISGRRNTRWRHPQHTFAILLAEIILVAALFGLAGLRLSQGTSVMRILRVSPQ